MNTAIEPLSAEEREAREETLYLSSIPGMRESIIKGMKEKLEDCAEDIELYANQ